MKSTLHTIYQRLYSHFGPQHWWPADNAFEVIIGAILTQNTNWANVRKATHNLKQENLLSPKKLYKLPLSKLAKLIRPAGYYNIKAKRIKEFLHFFFRRYEANLDMMFRIDTECLRRQLLDVKGIGPETADSILLYAGNKPVFVVDAYTKRILLRHKIIDDNCDYHKIQKIFMENLPEDTRLFNEYHALLVKLGKEFCLKNKPKCNICPLK